MGPNNPEHSYNPERKEPSKIDKLDLAELKEYQKKYMDKSIIRNQIDESEFGDVYKEEEINRDLFEVKAARQRFEISQYAEVDPDKKENAEKIHILAKLFEVMCADHSVLSRAFNIPKQYIKAQMSSDYDDIANGIDVIVEFPEFKKTMPLPKDFSVGMDMTISKRKYTYKIFDFKKFLFTDKKIPKVKYFNESRYKQPDHRAAFKGEYELPKLIIDIDPESLVDLKDVWKKWLDQKDNFDTEPDKMAYLRKIGLIDNPLWLQIVHQAAVQSQILYKNLKYLNKELSDSYGRVCNIFFQIQKNMLDGFIQRDKEMSMKLMEINNDPHQESREARKNVLRVNKLKELRDRRTEELIQISQQHLKK